uniref:Translocon-associated protein subunit gamma n=1 Tax=Panagrolaimus sp. JU765 TaxID=591449 RepID=A0AC34QCJ1_9BILA
MVIITTFIALVTACLITFDLNPGILERTETIERVITEYYKDSDEIILVELSELVLEKQYAIALSEAIFISVIYNNILFVSSFLVFFHYLNHVHLLDPKLSYFDCLLASSLFIELLPILKDCMALLIARWRTTLA